ncbi:Ubiquitin domain-containing protein 7SL RNA1 [Sesamum alatum]|uniref:Ubiquitin domain-containing protein 7SL RNA1 n=1 Tax=Sesamum alatum TaxID=300844 RepID=A0AAE2CQ67_9LAMI|nr:Ubiquitin domain-containing protein 7SL RNA1 [Sesamum alatum]
MDVIFQPSRGSPFYIEVGYFDTVLEIKEKIHKDQGIPVSKQTLIFNGNILQDDLNVHNSDILDRSRIHLLVASDATTHPTKTDDLSTSKIQLLLKMPSSKLGIALEMDVTDPVRRLKEKIQEMEGVPINRLAVHANGIELHDHKSMQDCELSDNSEIDVVVRSAPVTTTSRSSSGNMNSGSRKLRVVVLTKCGTEKIPVEVNSSDNVGELRKKLQKLKLDLPQEGYFFIYKQNVMDDDRSFRWHHVCQGDTIEIFSGSVSGGS